MGESYEDMHHDWISLCSSFRYLSIGRSLGRGRLLDHGSQLIHPEPIHEIAHEAPLRSEHGIRRPLMVARINSHQPLPARLFLFAAIPVSPPSGNPRVAGAPQLVKGEMTQWE